jgi:DNA-binding CsgD family transcriptional regulator
LLDQLTRREMQVFRLLGQQKSVTEIQEIMGVCRKTVEFYKGMIRDKMGYRHQNELLYNAIRKEWDLTNGF